MIEINWNQIAAMRGRYVSDENGVHSRIAEYYMIDGSVYIQTRTFDGLVLDQIFVNGECINAFSYMTRTDPTSYGLRSMPKTGLENYKKIKKGGSYKDCGICTEVCSKQMVHTCGNVFHKNCITKWYETNPTCPFCREH
jgi:hypothetical protein